MASTGWSAAVHVPAPAFLLPKSVGQLEGHFAVVVCRPLGGLARWVKRGDGACVGVWVCACTHGGSERVDKGARVATSLTRGRRTQMRTSLREDGFKRL